MLNRFYFLEDAKNAACLSGGSITAAHVLDGGAGQVEWLVDHYYSDGGNHPFCIALRGGDTAALGRAAMLLFFHPCYAVAEKGKPVFVEGPASGIEQVFREQRLEMEVISLESVRMLTAEGHDPAGDYYRYCLTSYSPEDVFVLSGGELTEWMSGLKRVDKELEDNHESWYQLALDGRAASVRAASQEREIGRLREERKIMQELLELGNKHDEVNYILKFYKNEYEILPLWYKRFGHIIKVIQGKRSFRSLFDKRVKKYKD